MLQLIVLTYTVSVSKLDTEKKFLKKFLVTPKLSKRILGCKESLGVNLRLILLIFRYQFQGLLFDEGA